MATITFLNKPARHFSGHITKNYPKSIHIQRDNGLIVIPTRWVKSIQYDNESEKQ